MRVRWRLPVALTACVIVAQLLPLSPLVDVVTWTAPASARLSYPLWHVAFAPFTLLADWLNGGSRRDLIGCGIWAVVAYALLRLAAGDAPARRRPVREAAAAVLFAAGLAAFVALGSTLAAFAPGVPARDPLTLVAASTVLAAVVVAACLVPAWRAGRVDPALTLGAE